MKGWMVDTMTTELMVMGRQVKLTEAATGVIGALFVFKTKKAARSVFGKNVHLVEIKTGEK